MNDINNYLKMIRRGSIITAVLSILLGLLFLFLPQSSAAVICSILGIILISCGAVMIGVFVRCGYMAGSFSLVAGIALILAGLFCITNSGTIMGFLNVILGFFIIVDGASSMQDSLSCMHAKTPGWPFMVALSALSLILGVILVFGRFDAIMFAAGISLVVNGVCDLIFSHRFSGTVRNARQQFRDKRRDAEVIDVDWKDVN